MTKILGLDLGTNSIGWAIVEKTGNVTRKWQNGFLSSYLLWMVLGLVVIIGSYFINK